MSAVPYLSFGMINVGVNQEWKLNWYLILYYIVCILIAANLGGWLWNRGQPVGAILGLALLLLVFIFFGLRWFSDPDTSTPSCPSSNTQDPEFAGDLNPFPPSLNHCPDFMVAYTEPSGRILCYDVNNTYEMKNATGAGLTTGLTINGVGGQSAYVRKTVGGSDRNSKYPILEAIPTSLINDPKGKYVRWEGVYNGVTSNTTRPELNI